MDVDHSKFDECRECKTATVTAAVAAAEPAPIVDASTVVSETLRNIVCVQ